jgi:hypothetical protein
MASRKTGKMSSVHQRTCFRLKTETGKALPEASRKDLALV